jgi:hypothetical protein
MHVTQLVPHFWAPIDIFRYATKEPCNAATQYGVGNEATNICPTPGSREVTLISGRVVPSGIAI